uniref:Disease resistance N-terminal domain-containing protein n=2 Tax=Aegilops tauschii TaxID=37682 RepID=M8BXR1_AEGTA
MNFPVKFHLKTHGLCFSKVDTQAKHSTYQRRGCELDMDLTISAVASEFVSRFISFLINKYSYSSHIRLEEKVDRLQHLLMRVHTVVEEADGRYIMNSRMVMQLQLLSEAMYQGYHVVDTFRYQSFVDKGIIEVCNSSILPFAIPLKRTRTIACTRKDKVVNLDLDGALQSMQSVVANMMEFVVLLDGCDRMVRRPYDSYLYYENIMFGRHVEKQMLLNFLLQQNTPGDEPAVLPIIGGCTVGKKTLVAHVCSDERVRSRFSSVLHFSGENLLKILEHESTMFGKVLVVVEFASNVDDNDWRKFHSFVKRLARGSKVIIISKLQRSARFGSVKPIFLNNLSFEELWYLFKTLAFGSANPEEHPRLVPIAQEYAKMLHMEESLLVINPVADVLRNNLNVQFWLFLLKKRRRMLERNLSIYGVDLKIQMEQGYPLDLTDYALNPLRAIPYSAIVPRKKELPTVTLGDLVADPSVRPKGEFNLVTWESRIPPYNSASYFVPDWVQDMPEGTLLPGRKRREFHV